MLQLDLKSQKAVNLNDPGVVLFLLMTPAAVARAVKRLRAPTDVGEATLYNFGQRGGEVDLSPPKGEAIGRQ
jgi:hypothetical protein